MDKVPEDLRRRYGDRNADMIPVEHLRSMDRREVARRLAYAHQLRETGDRMSGVDRASLRLCADAILKALPGRTLAEQVARLEQAAKEQAGSDQANVFKSAAAQLRESNPQVPYNLRLPEHDPAPAPQVRRTKAAAPQRPAAGTGGMIYKRTGSGNAAWYKREFARLELEEQAERYEQTANDLKCTDRELSRQYTQMAADARGKLERGDY